jgi:uncharacterized membrane protein YhaH (DUF805 family)
MEVIIMSAFFSELYSNALNILTNKYADFEGRSRRREFWYFYLAVLIVTAVLSIFSGIRFIGWVFVVASSLVGLAVMIPSIACGIRRLHDIGKSGWYMLVALIPIVGGIWLIVLFATDSTPGPNEYGPNPKFD